MENRIGHPDREEPDITTQPVSQKQGDEWHRVTAPTGQTIKGDDFNESG